MWWQIVVRGSQSGGQFLLTKKGFIGWKGLNPKRAKLPQTVGRGFYLVPERKNHFSKKSISNPGKLFLKFFQ